MVVARAGAVADPPVKVPAALRPILRFTRLNARALQTVRRAVEEDDELRSRVLEAVDEDAIGRPAWLWLARPDRWREDLDALVAGVEEDRQESEAVREVTRLRRAVAGTEASARRAEAGLQRAEEDAARAREASAGDRAARREAEERAGRLEAEVARLDAERAAAVRAGKDLEDQVERERVDHEARVEAQPAGPDVAGLVGDLSDAASVAAGLGARLAEVARGLGGPGASAAPPGGGQDGGRARPGSERRRLARRRPRPLPGGVFEDSTGAAEHLFRLPGAVLLVDGYNVSMAVWPEQAILEQRRRLVDALEELHARTGVDPVVVFDGTAAGGPAPGSGSRSVRVRFTDADVEADDVVIASVDAFPLGRPVIVASSDQRVRTGARTRGANLITTPQLRSVLRR